RLGVLARVREDADDLAVAVEDRRAWDGRRAFEIDVERALQRLALFRFRIGAALERDGVCAKLARLGQERFELAVRRIGVGGNEAVEPATRLRDQEREVPRLVLVADLRLH